MIPDLYTGQPVWLIIFCLLLAGGYSMALYLKDGRNEFPTSLIVLLGSSRFIAVFLISFMLLAPFTRSVTKDKEKPVIILAIDNSQSILMNADSGNYRTSFLDNLRRLSDRMSDKADMRYYYFGEKPVLFDESELSAIMTYDHKITDLAGIFTEFRDLYENRNVGALIVASDGIYNTGSNPLYSAKNWPYRVYTIAMGDTSKHMDQIIAKVNFNRTVYLNSQFPLEIIINARGAQGRKSSIQVYHEGNVVHSQDFVIGKDDFTQSFPVILNANQTGLQKFNIILDEIEGELSTVNNRKEIFIEVLDARNRILILSAAPHPDISALKQAISSNMNYESEHSIAADFTGKLESFNLVILHQLPSVDNPADVLINSIFEKGIPALFILGNRSDLARFNQHRSGLNLITGKPDFEEAVPVYNRNFMAFNLQEDIRSWVNGLPPLICPLGDYQVSNATRILLNQRIGQVETSRPLIMFSESPDTRNGVIAGEGIWKWRLYNYAKTNNHEYFNELINKIVQFLSLKDQKRNFRIYHPVNFRENESVIFDAEVYDETFELTNEPEVEMTVRNEDGIEFPYNFNKVSDAYHLDAGKVPPGYYTYEARVNLGSLVFYANGQFSVSAVDLEALNTIADHHLMAQIARDNGGGIYYPDQMDELAVEILQRDDIKPVAYARKKYDDLLNKGWLLALIIGLLSLEWFLRKRAGSY